MSNNIAVGSRSLLGVLFTALLAVSGLTSCGGPGESNTTTNTPPATPAVSLSATSTSVAYNASTDIAWSSTDSTSCASSGGGGTASSGSFNTGALTTSTAYTVTCTGAGGSASQTITITVASAIVPAVSLSAASTSIAYNASTTISWASTDSTSCASSGGGGTGTSGSFNTGALTTTTAYTVTCAGAGGSASQSITITVASPSVFSIISGFADAGGGNVTVTSANSLTNGTAITISGTTNYNGTYTVASVTPASFTIVATFNGNDATGVWQLAGGMISGCSTTGDTGAITLANVPSRFTGVAPLSVFFDASGTTATATTRPFHDLEYRWNFGDASAGTWANGARPGASSKNSATGPVAAHVFETPGLYTVALTATDGTNTVSNSCAQIAVQDPDMVFAGANTICFSTSGTFTECPAGATQVTTLNFVTAISTYQATGKRLLFRRGETFAAATSAGIDKTGPGVVGAFGTGASPIVQMTGNTRILQLSSNITPTIRDWRVMDLELDGLSKTSSEGIVAEGGMDQVTILRVDMHDSAGGISFSPSVLDWHNNHGDPGHVIWDQLAVVDSSMQRAINDSAGSYIGAKRFSFLGNRYDDATLGQHVLRLPFVAKGVISNSTLSRPGYTKLVLKLHGPTWCDSTATTCNISTDTPPPGVLSSGYSEKIIISDNKFINGNTTISTPWTVVLAPQNAENDERLRDIIVERNWFDGTNSLQQTALRISAVDTTVRNNICDMTGASSHYGISVIQTGIEPPPNNVGVFSNTVYSGSTDSFYGISIDTPATNVTVKNNLGSAPFATNPIMINGTGGAGFIQSNNLLNNAPSALFVSATPVVPLDFSLKALPNPARDAGLSTVPVFSDFFGTSRPQNGATDIGAVEGP